MLGAGVAFSMDGRGRFLDNIFIERLWRSLKYEAVVPARAPRRAGRRGDHRFVDRFLQRGAPPLGRARRTATARGRRERPASCPAGRCRMPAGSRPSTCRSTSQRTGAHTHEAQLAIRRLRARSPPADRGLRFQCSEGPPGALKPSRNPPWLCPRTVQQSRTTPVLGCAIRSQVSGAVDERSSLAPFGGGQGCSDPPRRPGVAAAG